MSSTVSVSIGPVMAGPELSTLRSLSWDHVDSEDRGPRFPRAYCSCVSAGAIIPLGQETRRIL